MRFSKIKAKLAKGEAALCTQLHVTDPSVFELTSLMGLDAIWMDLEHHGYSLETAGQLMRRRPRGHIRHYRQASKRRIHATGPTARSRRSGNHVSAMR